MKQTRNQISIENEQEIKIQNPVNKWNMKTKADLKDTLDRDVSSLDKKEVTNNMKKELLQIQSGNVLFFNTIRGYWFITPSIEWKKPLIFKCFGNTFNSWEKVNYIEINDEVIVTESWKIKFIKDKRETENDKDNIEMMLITPEDQNKKSVVVKSNDTNVNFDDFEEWDRIEFVINKKGSLVAIKKI